MRALADPMAAAGGARWGDLRKRTLTAVVLAPIVLACVWVGGLAWHALIVLATAGLMYEWIAMTGRRGPGQGIGMVVIGGLYLGLPMLCLDQLRGDAAPGRANLVFLVAVVWASDIGAYVVGRIVGGAKLAPSISPGKTRSGAVGGLLVAMLVGALVARALAPGNLVAAVAIAGVLAAVSQAGDLLESWIKRRFGVKDSGWLVPGHGGLLDRLDGLLTAAPAAALIAVVSGRGVVLWN